MSLRRALNFSSDCPRIPEPAMMTGPLTAHTTKQYWGAYLPSSPLPPSQASRQQMSLSDTEFQGAEDIERQRKRAQNVRRFTTRFRVLIIGRANAGKTTILQRVCHTTEQPRVFTRHGHEIDVSELSPTALRGEHDIENEMTFESNKGFVFHDSRGFEAGSASELDKVRDFVEKHSNYQSIGNHLHVIWYCIPINDEARPITRAELNFFDECGTGRVPVIVLFTKADMLDAQTMDHLVDAGMNIEDAAIKAPEESIARFQKKFGWQLYKKKYPPKEHLYFRGVEDVLNYTGWPSTRNAKTFEDIAFLCITTTIITDNSYFQWKQKPSASSAPFKLAIQKFNSSVDLEKIKTAIKDASHLKTKDQKAALVKIAMENRICELLIPEVFQCLFFICLI
ncbi:hypothetical protein K443DRAFT_8737 [Laccaria amethystina LaAM-08-1]|uniref:G domain-containing protein n=1 Tax=Laccaria amethystina LaAM-08-1 TaxID=1095629 RepID=A0A0C9WNE1_9AGAR|nr:hypothetical protein K443DRAFT_8737 [Laccaria amethystina LaAM-08-1]